MPLSEIDKELDDDEDLAFGVFLAGLLAVTVLILASFTGILLYELNYNCC